MLGREKIYEGTPIGNQMRCTNVFNAVKYGEIIDKTMMEEQDELEIVKKR